MMHGPINIKLQIQIDFPLRFEVSGGKCKQIITLCHNVKSQQHTFNIQPTVFFPQKKGQY